MQCHAHCPRICTSNRSPRRKPCLAIFSICRTAGIVAWDATFDFERFCASDDLLSNMLNFRLTPGVPTVHNLQSLTGEVVRTLQLCATPSPSLIRALGGRVPPLVQPAESTRAQFPLRRMKGSASCARADPACETEARSDDDGCRGVPSVPCKYRPCL